MSEMRMELPPFLKFMVQNGASDLFIYAGAAPNVKVEGRCKPISKRELTADQVKQICYSAMDEEEIKEYETHWELNKAITVEEFEGRFRLNIFWERGACALVARHIKTEIPTLDSLGLPDILKDIIMRKRGLVLVVGATGVGKSTTLASMIRYRSQQTPGHILCIENPIEFLHRHDKSLIGQREIGIDTHDYHNALMSAMREAPDVIMIGEILDEETMRKAISFAETGHLCLATLHASNARQALDRVQNFFHESIRDQVRNDLALHLQAIIAQRLPIGVDGKRCAALEIMLNTPEVREHIMEGETEFLAEAMMKSLDDGSQPFDHALFELVITSQISLEEALRQADSANDLALKLRMEGFIDGDDMADLGF